MAGAREVDPVAVLRQLLERHPEARISATAADGIPQPVPAGLELGPKQAAVLSAGLAGYLPEDRPAILAGFDRALTFGVGHATARALHDPATPLMVHLLDTRVAYGVLLTVIVSETNSSTPEQLHAVPAVAARIARVKKSVTATLLEVDDATTEILGWKREEMVGRRSLEFIHPDDQGLAIESWLHLMTVPDLQARVRLRHHARDGSWIWFETSNTNLLSDADPHVLTEMVDITAEMAAQHELQAREQLLSQLAQALPLGVFRVDTDGRLDYTNSRLFEILGIASATEAEDLIGAVGPGQRRHLQLGFAAVLEGAAERMIDVQLANSGTPPGRVCQFSLRPLLTGGVVTGLVGCVHDITDSVQLRRELERQATVDGLTGCLNRGAVLSRLEVALTQARDGGHGIAVVFVDLDLFKDVNDELGHAAGDELLQRSAERLRFVSGDDGTVGRLGGDEFLVVCPGLATEAAAAALGARIRDCLQEPVSLHGHLLRPSASVGMAWSADAQEPAQHLVARADRIMYADKRAKGHEAVGPSAAPGERRAVPRQTRPVVPIEG